MHHQGEGIHSKFHSSFSLSYPTDDKRKRVAAFHLKIKLLTILKGMNR